MASGVLRSVYIYYETVVGLLSLAMNAFLIYLVLSRTSPSMKQYGFIILLNACVDLIFCLTNLITVESVDMRDGLMFMFNLGPLRHFSAPVPLITSCVWMLSLLLLIINLPMQFYYRCELLRNGRAVNMARFVKIYACAFGLVFVQSCLFSLVYYTRTEETVPFRSILQKNPLYAEDTPKFIVGDTKETVTFLHITNTQLIAAVSYIAVFYYSWKIFNNLQKMRPSMTTAVIRVQNQLTRVMFLHVAYPLIVFYLPIVATCFCSTFSLDWPFFGITCSYIVTLVSLMNPIAVIFIVPSYKRYIVKRLRTKTVNTQNPNSSRMTIFGPVANLVLLSFPT